MAQLNTTTDNLLHQSESPNRRTSKVRLNLPHNSILFNNGNYNEHSSNSRATRQSIRSSFMHSGQNHRLNRYENTYHLEPNDDNKLDIMRIHRVAMNIIETAMINYKYNGKEAKGFIEMLAERIRNQMKLLPFTRYKIITQVSVGQKKGQDLRIVSQCLWNLQSDRHITIRKETLNAYVIVTIFFVYTE
ncbi:hypothetical protein I4U23_010127 [Adineta vaga]|nr:hypothetical protein I4U23_010127 [Adineta vaga]